ncbi:MAG: polysaccharide deacetylase [Lachnospiraceae bacterium]|nr:polysaccharide deacetylase [Lachnospiraceae bacterium]
MAVKRKLSPSERQRRRRKAIALRILTGIVVAGLATGLFFAVRAAYRGIRGWVDSVMNDPLLETTTRSASTEASTVPPTTEDEKARYAQLLNQAEELALSYDYDGAMALIQSHGEFGRSAALQEAYQGYLKIKTTLKKVDISEVYHVFFHSLIVEPDRAFADPADRDGYNQVMTTMDEFNAMMDQMYERGFVLVKLHDMAYTNEQGEFVKGSIFLPEGKKPFVLSVDDVSYYDYMRGDGFASKVLLDSQNQLTCEYVKRDGSVVTGDYDVIPLLERFIRLHPDFSYKGARGCIALTGYEGILGYRTAPMYGDPTHEDYKPEFARINVAQEREEAARVAARMEELGWEFASHSWGHINMDKVDIGWLQNDMTKWKNEVDSLLGNDTDILIFAFGVDFGSWRPYTQEDPKYRLLKSMGFRYFCPVDSFNIPWVQFSASEGFLRHGRVNLDGYEMYYKKDKCDIFFDTETVFDKSRPLPVPTY